MLNVKFTWYLDHLFLFFFCTPIFSFVVVVSAGPIFFVLLVFLFCILPVMIKQSKYTLKKSKLEFWRNTIERILALLNFHIGKTLENTTDSQEKKSNGPFQHSHWGTNDQVQTDRFYTHYAKPQNP